MSNNINNRKKAGFFEDLDGNRSSTRLITFIAAITGLAIAISSNFFEYINTSESLPLIITLLSFAAGQKSLNTFIESKYKRPP